MGRIARILLGVLAVFGLAAASDGARGGAGEPAASPSRRTPVIWVELPGARASIARELAHAGLLPWTREALEAGDLRPVSADDARALERLRASLLAGDVRIVDTGSAAADRRGMRGSTVLALAPELREACAWLDGGGAPTAALLSSWSGERDWTVMRRMAGLDEALRWEEVEEFLSLAPAQSAALRRLGFVPEHPLWRLRRAFASDKLFANVAVYYGHTSRASLVLLHLDLARRFEEDLVPWTSGRIDEAGALFAGMGSAVDDDVREEAADRLFFLRRLRSSRPRVYGRCDRILQSVHAEWGGRACVILDASRSAEPFVALRAPADWPDTGDPAGDLASCLARLGWDLPGEPGGAEAMRR